MTFSPVLLWSDALIWLLVLAVIMLGVASARNPLLRTAWRRVGRNRTAMSAATVLLVFVLIGLLDSLHYRPQLASRDASQPVAYAVDVRSLLDALTTPLRTRHEKTYSEPLATRAYAKESSEIVRADSSIGVARDFPRLKYGGAHLGEHEAGRAADIAKRVLAAEALAAVILACIALGAAYLLAPRSACSARKAWRGFWRSDAEIAWNAVLLTFGVVLVLALPLIVLSPYYHVFGTDKVGLDVFYQILKSVRTALVIGLVTTLVTLPLAILFGIWAGYFRGWVDDVIQYLYITLSSIPGVLLIAAAVLMMQVVIDTHPDWFTTSAERADARLLALCLILAMTSWTGVARLLRGETLKLRELEFVQAAQAFGVGRFAIMRRHILPNLMHIVLISLVMDFSGLVLAEAVLSYVGVGVDPTTISFGTMINTARMELAREPMVWWSLMAAFSFMFALVLAANLLADAVRDAFDPRIAGSS